MTKLFLLLLLPLLLNASKILSYNIYDRTDRVDIMITFDTPYTGKIKQNVTPSKIIIKLEDASIEASKSKTLNSKFLQAITITPLGQNTRITALVPDSVTFKASKTSDSYGLRLRFAKTATFIKDIAEATTENSSQNSLSSLPTKQDSELSQNYYIVIAILLIGIVILFVLKNKMNQPMNQHKSNSWLFKVANDSKNETTEKEVSIRFQKNIDEKSSVVMLDFVGQSYLVLMGSNNVLLDKFIDNKPTTQDDFETILQNRHEELNDFLHEGEQEEKDPMQIYKEKAANISYTV